MGTLQDLITGARYRESLRRLRPVVYVDGRRLESVADLLNKLGAVPLCQETGCAQRYLAHGGLAARGQSAARLDGALGRTAGLKNRGGQRTAGSPIAHWGIPRTV